MADFASAVDLLFLQEGGYSFEAADPGGETYRGITRKNFPKWPGWAAIDGKTKPIAQGAIFPEIDPLAADFYKENFWGEYGMIGNQRLAGLLFSMSVDMGTGKAVELLQEVEHSTEDGVWGTKTLMLATEQMLVPYAARCIRHYVSLEEFPIYGDGWIRRVLECVTL